MSVQIKGSGTIGGIDEGLNITGVTTATNFKTGVSNLHSTGLTLTGGQLDIGSNIKLGTAGVVTATSFVGSGANLTGITQTTINNNANNRIITGSGSANTLEAESALTFNGTDLEIQPASAAPALFVGDSNRTGAGQGLVHFRGNWNGTTVARITIDTGDDTTNKDDGIIRFDTSSTGSLTERIRITRDGKLGIGNVSSPDEKIEIRTFSNDMGVLIKSTGSTSNALQFDANRSGANQGIGNIKGRWNGTTVAQIFMNTGDDTTDKNDGYIIFGTESAASNGNVNATERMRIRADGNVSIADGNLIVASGHGIDFSATANAQPGQYNSINPTTDSEILHDYEFGSFTPHIRTQGGTSNATYSAKGGYYTKIGRQVYCTFFMNWSNGSNHSGYIYFVGLPYFSGSNTATHLMYGIGTVQLNGFTISGNRNPLLHMGQQTSGTNLASNNSGGNSINEGHTSNGYIIANITYIANY